MLSYSQIGHKKLTLKNPTSKEKPKKGTKHQRTENII